MAYQGEFPKIRRAEVPTQFPRRNSKHGLHGFGWRATAGWCAIHDNPVVIEWQCRARGTLVFMTGT